MLRPPIRWLAAAGIVFLATACSLFPSTDTTALEATTTTVRGTEETTTTATDPPTTTTVPTTVPIGPTTTVTTSTSGSSTTTTEAALVSALDGNGERPPGAEDQLSYTVLYFKSCSGTLNGPGQLDDDFELVDTWLTQLALGELVWRELIRTLAEDPGASPDFDNLVPIVTFPPQKLLVPPSIAVDPEVLAPGVTLGTLPPAVTLPPVAAFPTMTLPPGVTLPPLEIPSTDTVVAIEQTETFRGCGTGWGPDETLDIVITDPSGELAYEGTTTASEHGGAAVFWRPGLGNAVGFYTAELSNRSHTATAVFEVIVPQRPTVGFLSTATQPGGTILLSLGGFPASEGVDLHVYRNGDDFGGWEWAGTLRVAVDADGRSSVRLDTLETDPLGIYCVLPAIEGAKPCTEAEFEIVAAS